MTKPVEEMSMEEIKAERAAIAAERMELMRKSLVDSEILEEVPTPVSGDDEDDDEDTLEPWPHTTMEYGGRTLEVRKPNESALMAVSMTSVPSLGPQTQMRILTKFLTNHLSPESFAEVVGAMTDPDSGVDIQGLITALTKLHD